VHITGFVNHRGPSTQHPTVQDGFWTVLPKFLKEWYDKQGGSELIQIMESQAPLYLPGERLDLAAVRLITESHQHIASLFANETSRSALILKATELLDHHFGDLVIRLIGAAFQAYDNSILTQHVEFLQREPAG
jgi:hypothetical protein